MNYILGLDIGTTHAKAMAMTADGQKLHASMEKYEPIAGLPAGYHEFDPDTILNACLRLILDACKALGSHTLSGISISAAMHSLLLVDEQNRPLTNLLTWADLRSIHQADAFIQSGTDKWLYRKTGTPVHPMSPLCKIQWFREHHYKLFKSAHKFIGCKEYLVYHLCGNWFTDHSIASATGLFNIHDKCWDVAILKLIEVSVAQLPVSVPNRFQCMITNPVILQAAANRQPLPLVIGSSDGCLANLGSGATGASQLSITVGTSGAVRKVVNKIVLDENAANFCYVFDESNYITGGPINNAGNLLKWFSRSMLHQELETPEQIRAFFDGNLQSSDRPLFLPYIQGERAPVWNAGARGLFLGIRSEHSLSDFQQAVGESICYALRQLVEIHDSLHGHSSSIILSGGLSKCPEFVRLLASILNRTVTMGDDADASAIGACMLGWSSLLQQDRGVDWLTRSAETFVEPDPTLALLHQGRFAIYKKIYAANKALTDELNLLSGLL